MVTPLDATTRHNIFVQRLQQRSVNEIVEMVNALGNEIYVDIVASDLETLTRRQLQALQRRLERAIYDGYVPINEEITNLLREFSDEEAAWQGDMLVRTGLVTELGVASDADIWAAVNAEPFEGRILAGWLAGLPAGTAQRVRETVTQGYADGLGALEVARQVRGTRSQTGDFTISKRGAETMVRTAYTHTASVAREMTYDANEGIKWEQHVSILDGRTTPVCFPAETEITPVGEVLGAFKREFSGDFITIRTSAGNEVTGTINHPVLTSSGWLPLHEIKPNDKVINAVSLQSLKVGGIHDVSMKANIGAIFNAISIPPFSRVDVLSSSKAQFHGDGMGPDHEVNVSVVNGELWNGINSNALEGIKKPLLGGVHAARVLPTDSSAAALFFAGRPVIKAAKINTASLEALIKPAFGSPISKMSKNFGRPDAFVKHGDSSLFVSQYASIPDTPCEGLHDAMLLEKAGDSSDGCVISCGNFSSGHTGTIELDNVISVRREFRTCHVYNLHTSTGYYIANGILVKNCQSLSGRIFERGSKASKQNMPPLHPACRSSRSPLTERSKAKAEQSQTYQQWLKRQPKAIQDDILGKTKGQLFRDGGLTVDRFVNDKGRTYTLEQLRERDAWAWEQAFKDDTVEEAIQSVRA